MAVGDLTMFEEWLDDDGNAVHNYDTGNSVWKLLLINNTSPPTAADLTPRLSDYVANEVDSVIGGYPANGITVANTVWSESAGVGTFDGDNIALAQDVTGFTNAWWGILYNDTAAADQAIAFIELGGPVSEQAGPININWSSAPAAIFTKTIV